MKYAEIAKKEATKYYDYTGLIGIIWVGSSAFGIDDEWADIDVRLLVKNPVKIKPMQQYKVADIKIEVDEMNWDWLFNDLNIASDQAWIIEKSIVLYDPDGKTTMAFTEAKKKLASADVKQLLWENYCKLYYHYDLEKSLKRNQIVTAHIILSNLLDALSKFIFLYHNRVVPPLKWRWYMIRKEKLFDATCVDKLVRLNLDVSEAEITALIREIQTEAQTMMLAKGYEKDRVMEPWRF